MANNNNVYSNWAVNNPNSNAKVYFLSTQQPPTSGAGLQATSNPVPKNSVYSEIYQSGVFPQAATLPATPLPSFYGQLPRQVVQTVQSSQGSVGVQTQVPPAPQVQLMQVPRAGNQQPLQVLQVSRTGNQPPVTVGIGTSTGCTTCPGSAGNLITQVTRPAPQYVPVVNPNGVQGWYPALVKAPTQGPIIRTTDEIRYPSVAPQQEATVASNPPVVAKQEVVKTQAARSGYDSGSSYLDATIRETRTIGSVLTLLGSLTVGLGIAGVVLYHSGKKVDSGLSWCYEAHAANNELTKGVLPSSPGINYVTSGAGILGIMTFIVGVMTMNLESTGGPLPNATMWTSIFTLPVLVLMAILSLLSFIMTFPDTNTPPTCVALTVVTFLEVVMAIIPFILLFVIYCKMQHAFYGNQSTYGQYSDNTGDVNEYSDSGRQVYPASKVSVIKVQSPPPGAAQCYCNCCPCCLPNRCCPECNSYSNMREEYVEEVPAEEPAKTTTTPTAVAFQPAANPIGCVPAVRYPGGNNQYLWNQMAPFGQYSKAVYTPYAFNFVTK